MSLVTIVAGLGLLGVLAYDALSTTLGMTTPAGPLTARTARRWWQLARRLARGPHSLLLSVTGPFILVMTFTTWVLLLWAGWTLVFSAVPEAVVSSASGAPADTLSRIYFAAYTTFTLGIGDYVPQGGVWQLATSLSVISGLALTTTAITYLVPVVTAVTILHCGVTESVRPHPIAVRSVRHATTQLLQRLDDRLPPAGDALPVALEQVRRAGIPTVDDDTFGRRLDGLAHHRNQVSAFARESMWAQEVGD